MDKFPFFQKIRGNKFKKDFFILEVIWDVGGHNALKTIDFPGIFGLY